MSTSPAPVSTVVEQPESKPSKVFTVLALTSAVLQMLISSGLFNKPGDTKHSPQ